VPTGLATWFVAVAVESQERRRDAPGALWTRSPARCVQPMLRFPRWMRNCGRPRAVGRGWRWRWMCGAGSAPSSSVTAGKATGWESLSGGQWGFRRARVEIEAWPFTPFSARARTNGLRGPISAGRPGGASRITTALDCMTRGWTARPPPSPDYRSVLAGLIDAHRARARCPRPSYPGWPGPPSRWHKVPDPPFNCDLAGIPFKHRIRRLRAHSHLSRPPKCQFRNPPYRLACRRRFGLEHHQTHASELTKHRESLPILPAHEPNYRPEVGNFLLH
jgi:hypothetical protein